MIVTTGGAFTATVFNLNGGALVDYFATEGLPGMPFWVPHTYTYIGDHPAYVHGGTNTISVVNYWNGAEIDETTLVISYVY